MTHPIAALVLPAYCVGENFSRGCTFGNAWCGDKGADARLDVAIATNLKELGYGG